MQLDLAIAESRRLADAALESLRPPQAALRTAAADYIESVAARRIEASRHAAVAVMAQLGDGDIAELRFWAEGEVSRIRDHVEDALETCDFWIPETSGLSLTDVNTYATALVPRPKDSRSGIPQTLVLLFEESLDPLRRGLGVAGLALAQAEADPKLEVALVRAWQIYRKMAVEVLVTWADIDDRYQASTARFQEMRWELAGEADVSELEAERAAHLRRAAQEGREAVVMPAPALAAASASDSTAEAPPASSVGPAWATDRSGADLAVASAEA